MASDSIEVEWSALMRGLKLLGIGLQDLNATRLHKGDPVECTRLMRLLAFEVSREISYQMVQLGCCPTSSDAKLVQKVFRYLRDQSCYSPAISGEEFLFKTFCIEKYVILRRLAAHVYAYVGSRGHRVASLAMSSSAQPAAASRQRLLGMRNRYDQAMYSSAVSKASRESDSDSSESWAEDGSTFRASPDKLATRAAAGGKLFAGKAFVSYLDSPDEDEEGLPAPPPPLSPVGVKRGIGAVFRSQTDLTLGLGSNSSDRSIDNSSSGAVPSWRESALESSTTVPLSESLKTAIACKGRDSPPTHSSTSYLQKNSDVSVDPVHEPRRYIPSSDLLAVQPQREIKPQLKPDLPDYLSRYLADYCEPQSVIVSKEKSLQQEQFSTTLVDTDDMWVRRSDCRAEDISVASADEIVKIMEREGVVPHGQLLPQHATRQSLHSTGIDYSYESNRMVSNKMVSNPSVKKHTLGFKSAAKSMTINNLLNESHLTYSSAVSAGRSAAAYSGHTFCTFCKDYGEQKTCCGLPAATLFHPHRRSDGKGGQTRAGVRLETWPWQIESNISYERVSGVQLHDNNLVYKYVDENYSRTMSPACVIKEPEKQAEISAVALTQRTLKDAHNYHNDDESAVRTDIFSTRQEIASDYFSFQTKFGALNGSLSAKTGASKVDLYEYKPNTILDHTNMPASTLKKSDYRSSMSTKTSKECSDGNTEKSQLSASINGYAATSCNRARSFDAIDEGRRNDPMVMWQQQELFDGVHSSYIDTLQSYRRSMEGDMQFMNNQIRRLEKQPL